MTRKQNTVPPIALLVAVALLVSLGVASLPAHAGTRPEEEIAELKRRVAKLEAELAAMRKAFRLAGGAPESTTEIKNIREVAKLRAAGLLLRARNTHALLQAVLNN